MSSEKKIISFSLWGSKPMYVLGAVRNAELLVEMQKRGKYAGYAARFYMDERINNTDVHRRLVDLGSEIVPKPAEDTYRGLFWRFEVAGDASLARFLVRDTDSRLNIRDAWAVQDWERSKMPFHCQRDHRHCHRVALMGGLWGAVRCFMPDFMDKMNGFIQLELEGCRNPGRGDKDLWGSDQNFLWRHVWPVIKDNHLCHDDWRLGLMVGSDKDRKYRVGLPDNMFVGQQFDIIDGKDTPIWPGKNP